MKYKSIKLLEIAIFAINKSTKIITPLARPFNPSIQFIALITPTIQKLVTKKLNKLGI